jgi:hypothetical protein
MCHKIKFEKGAFLRPIVIYIYWVHIYIYIYV